MTVRSKILLIIGLTLLVVMIVLYDHSKGVLLASFAQLESEMMVRNVKQAQDALDSELSTLVSNTTDWAVWDDTYTFVQNNNAAYRESNLTTQSYQGLQINVLAILDNNGHRLYARVVDLSTGQNTPVPNSLLAHLRRNSPLLNHRTPESRASGLVMLPDGPLLMAACPIVTSAGEGPIRGTVIMGRYLDANLVREIASRTHTNLSLGKLHGEALPIDFARVRKALTSDGSIETIPLSTQQIAGYGLTNDLYGEPSFIMRVTAPRAIYQHGLRTVHYFLVVLLVVGLLFGALVFLLLEQFVLSRLTRISKRIGQIGNQGDLAERLDVNGGDELAHLADEINSMLAALQSNQLEQSTRDAIMASEERYRALVELSPDAVYVICDDICVFTNRAGGTLLGAEDIAEVMGHPLFDFIHPSQHRYLQDRVKGMIADPNNARVEERIVRRDGTVMDIELLAVPFTYEGQPAMQLTAHDISAQKHTEEQLKYYAYHDPLTDLPNRLLFNDRLDVALAWSQRHRDPLAVMLIDLDRFKEVNETLGHEAGDRLLQQVADRLRNVTRKGDTVARTSGDEFYIISPKIKSTERAEEVAKRILEVFTDPFHLDGQELYITPSIGITLAPLDADSVEDLVKNADMAMYRAKAAGRNTYKFFMQDMSTVLTQRRTMEAHLRKAIEREEFVVYYQPQISVHSGQITGAEALVRWQHPDWGLVSPADFIPLAEETGLIEPLDEFVLYQACRQCTAWSQDGLPPLRIAVNLSARHFQQQQLAQTIARILEKTHLPAERLEIEITESTAMQHLERTLPILRQLYDLGLQIAIDDFGTGYSSLSYLKKFPIHTLKIDRSFVMDMLNNTDSAAIVVAMIGLTHNLRLSVIAEGVETTGQYNFLRAHQCDAVQGYLFGKPMPANEFPNLFFQPLIGIETPVVR